MKLRGSATSLAALLCTLASACTQLDANRPPPSEVAARREPIHDCPTCAGSVGAWAVPFGGHWCGGGHSREGIDGPTQTCWDACCCDHDYCFGRGVDGYQTCHDVLGNQTTNCIHGCDHDLCTCWQACNDIENANEVWFGRRRCDDGGSPRWCGWYQMWTCNRTLDCTGDRVCDAAGTPPATCCAQDTTASCAARVSEGTCMTRDWGCGVGSNWDDPYLPDRATTPGSSCGGSCRGDFDCTEAGCGYCSRDPSMPRVCRAPILCGGRCYVGDEGPTGCHFVVDTAGNPCERCVPILEGSQVGTCQPGQLSHTCQDGTGCGACTCAECPRNPGCVLLALARDGGVDAGTLDAGPPADAGVLADAGTLDAGPPDIAGSADFPVILVPVAGGANFRMGLAEYAVPIVVRFPVSMELQDVDARILQVNPADPSGPLIALQGGVTNIGDLLLRPPSDFGWHAGAAGPASELHLAIPGPGPPPTSQWIFGMIRAATTADERFVLRLSRRSPAGAPLRRADGVDHGTGPIDVEFTAPEGGTPGCIPGSSCAADWRWCCSQSMCVIARACTTPGAYDYGGCACCSGPSPFMPLACDLCYSATLEDVFATNCPGG